MRYKIVKKAYKPNSTISDTTSIVSRHWTERAAKAALVKYTADLNAEDTLDASIMAGVIFVYLADDPMTDTERLKLREAKAAGYTHYMRIRRTKRFPIMGYSIER